MELLPLHPKLVHFPIALCAIVPLVATLTLVGWRRGFFDRRSWLLVVALQAMLAIGSAVAMETGEDEEERVERVVAERYIEEHEEAAEIFAWSGAAVLLVMLFAGFAPSESAAKRAATIAVLGSFVVLGLGYRTGEAGGGLVYEHGAASAYVKGSADRAGVDALHGEGHGHGAPHHDDANSDSDSDSD